MHTRGAWVVVAAVLVSAAVWRVDAHKPITSPYTFTEDVLPILRDRCAACHVSGGVAPMALTTAEEAIPWGESIRLEVIAAHMPPWAAMSNGMRLRHAEGLTARELNVLLTWVTGGTPVNAPPPARVPAAADWRLGAPDAIVQLPEMTIGADEADITKEFVLALGASAGRPLRAVDLRPGTRSLVRSARVSVKTAAAGGDVERILALWVPGDTPMPLPPGVAFDVPRDAELSVRVRYKKTWEHEREVMRDRSEVGLYFAAERPQTVGRMPFSVAPRNPSEPGMAQGVVGGWPLGAAVRVLSIYPTAMTAGARIRIDAIPPEGLRQQLLEFSPRPGWDRRYVFEPPVDLPRGTQLAVSAAWDGETAMPSGGGELVVLDVVPIASR